MKKIFLVLLMLLSLGACAEEKTAVENDKIQIVTTIFPEYDWVRNIAGDKNDKVEITMLLDNGVDLHSYQPSVDDLMKITDCDLFVYVGGESDEWVEDALKQVANKDMIVLNLLEILGEKAKIEEHIEGMQEEDEEEREEEEEYDEHVWLSLNNAALFCRRIEEALASIDQDHASDYQANLQAYLEQLEKLDAEYNDFLIGSRNKTLICADRFPFRYLCDDYGLNYYAAFAGCSAETEASFDTVIFLAGKVDELDIDTVMVLEKTDHKIAETVIANTAAKDQKIVELDSLQSITAKDVENGVSYLEEMAKNLSGIKEALD